MLIGLLLALFPLGTVVGALITAPIRNRTGSAAATLSTAIAFIGIAYLSITTSNATLVLLAGATVIGVGDGIFWVCSQVLLSTNSGSFAGKSAYLTHYAMDLGGILLDSVLTGAFVAGLEAIGTRPPIVSQGSLALGVLATVAAYLLWFPKRWSIKDTAGGQPSAREY